MEAVSHRIKASLRESMGLEQHPHMANRLHIRRVLLRKEVDFEEIVQTAIFTSVATARRRRNLTLLLCSRHT